MCPSPQLWLRTPGHGPSDFCVRLEVGQQGTGRLGAIFILCEWPKTPAPGVPYLDE